MNETQPFCDWKEYHSDCEAKKPDSSSSLDRTESILDRAESFFWFSVMFAVAYFH